MTFNPQIDIGQVLVAATIVASVIGAHFTFKARLDGFEKMIERFGVRLDKHETALTTMVGQVQHVIGRLEEADRRIGSTDRRAH